jgi:hypothetical protein
MNFGLNYLFSVYMIPVLVLFVYVESGKTRLKCSNLSLFCYKSSGLLYLHSYEVI